MVIQDRRHLIIDGCGAPAPMLDDARLLRAMLLRIVDRLGAVLLHLHVHEFEPQGVTAFGLLAESHVAIHTWPEEGRFAADLFFCGDVELQQAVDELRAALRPATVTVTEVLRLHTGDAVTSDQSSRAGPAL